MDKLTENFSYDEFTHTGHTELQEKNRKQGEASRENMVMVCQELEKVRQFLCRPVYIQSGYRCPELNKVVGGSPTSQHMTGSAVDFVAKDFDDTAGLGFIFDWCWRHMNCGQLIFEKPAGRKPWLHFGLPRVGRENTRYIYEGGLYKPV